MKVHKALALALVLALAGPATAASAATDADAGVRDTDTPRTLRIGAPEQVVPVTVISDVPADFYEVVAGNAFLQSEGFAYGYADGAEPGRPNVFKVPVEVTARSIPAWGAATWFVDGYEEAGEDLDQVSFATRPLDVRANSLLGMSLKRYGDQVAVTASARAFHNVEGRYVPYSEKDVAVQAFTGEYWKHITGLTTDERGNRTTFPNVPPNTPLRLVMRDTRTVWGAVSSSQKI